ncbi:hypothetical protein VCR15J2_390130 [Vibrio coralliirubri]|uniref:hypothetical protein n=1 Tax=Vibrio coralliirubri TaxID=1516159 RepID=UPI0006386810|nr:hypothetical protein [Vibrio coralliirubri]CDT54086.1 hypothetical protein VCR15J2_390130 [Vibrio coralliirubri]
MNHQPFTRSEIVKRSRQRQKILKEEAGKRDIVCANIWVSKCKLDKIRSETNLIDEFIDEAIAAHLERAGRPVATPFPLEEARMSALIKQKRQGL